MVEMHNQAAPKNKRPMTSRHTRLQQMLSENAIGSPVDEYIRVQQAPVDKVLHSDENFNSKTTGLTGNAQIEMLRNFSNNRYQFFKSD